MDDISMGKSRKERLFGRYLHSSENANSLGYLKLKARQKRGVWYKLQPGNGNSQATKNIAVFTVVLSIDVLELSD
jgi:hypothetical protein